MKNWKQVLFTFALMLFVNCSFAQFDKESCTTILLAYDKANEDFSKMNIATINFERFKQKFDISWFKTFKFSYMDTVLKIEYSTSSGTYNIYIPYSEIIKINTSKTAVDIIVRG